MATSWKVLATGALVLISLPLLYNNCAGTSGDSGPQVMATPKPTVIPLSQGKSCDYGSSSSAHVVTYGSFVPSTMDSCHSYDGDGSPSRWTGMSASTALIAPMASVYAGGAACGQCLQIEGPNGTVKARVASVCSSCTGGDIDVDLPAFQALTGAASGRYSVTVKNIPCPLTEPIKFYINSGSNPYYLNISVANSKHPIAAMDVDPGTGFVPLARVGTTAAFAATFPSPVGGTVQVRATDGFGQTVTASVSTALGATPTSAQFGDCR